MASRRKKHICRCLTHGCGAEIVNGQPGRCLTHGCGAEIVNGQPGRLVDARTLDAHAKADHVECVRMVNRQKQFDTAIDVREEELSQLVGNMALSEAATAGQQPQFRVDRMRAAIKGITTIHDDTKAMKQRITKFKANPQLDQLAIISQHVSSLSSDLNQWTSSTKDASVKTIFEEASSEIASLIKELQLVKESLKRPPDGGKNAHDTSHHFAAPLLDIQPLHQIVMFTAVVFSVILGASRRGCHWLFDMARYTVQTAALEALQASSPNDLPMFIQVLLGQFPRSVGPASEAFNLQTKSTVYAVCPSCHSIFPPDNSLPYGYRERCNTRTLSRASCGDLLLRPKGRGNHTIYVPIKPYIVYDFKDWLGGLLSKEGYESMMDDAWKQQDRSTTGGANLTSIFHGEVLREFKGYDGQHFGDGGDDGRYVFSLGAEFFNPLSNKIAGKKISCGCIIMACLNLPPELRYKPENMFLVGIIPGPHEPAKDATNPYLATIVDIFLEFWKPGVRYSQTFKYRLGRLIRCALVALICDILAARKFGGMAACTHEHFCTMCKCRRKTHGYGHLNPALWVPRTGEELRHQAEAFRAAQTRSQQHLLFNQNGMRWTEFLRLPYFDLSKFVVVDSMHNLLLGLIKEHFMGVLGYTSKSESKLVVLPISIQPEATNPPPVSENGKSQAQRLEKQLKQPYLYRDQEFLEERRAVWEGFTYPALLYVAQGLTGYVKTNGYTKPQIVDHIMDWRRSMVPQERYPETSGDLFTTPEIAALQEDVQQTITPSWVPSVPKNLGENSGKLRADEWRIVGALYLPITLTRLWSRPATGDVRAAFRLKLLEATNHLLSAVNIATSRETSGLHIKQYSEHILSYMRLIHEVVPEYKFRPNHHLAAHIADHLRYYGPVNGWWTFPFERVIGQLQRISTNYKLGEYERTIGDSWTRAQNLKTIFSKPNCPPILRHCSDFFSQLINPYLRGTLSLESGAGTAKHAASASNTRKVLSSDILEAFQACGREIQETLVFHEVVHPNGLRYTTRLKHRGNSNVLVLDGLKSWPASIQYIVRTPGGTDFMILVKRHKPLAGISDPFHQFPHLRAKMWSQQLYNTLDLVPMESVGSHFAKRDLRWDDHNVSIVVDLSRTFELVTDDSVDQIEVDDDV